jgi:nitrogen fixation/metabolism regulation signal transduction histidine kinase
MVAEISCGERQRGDTLRTTITALNAARDGFVVWDRQHQHEIVERASSRDQATTELEQYRAKREVVSTGFAVAYRAVAVAATSADQKSLDTALAAAGELYEAIKKLMGGG